MQSSPSLIDLFPELVLPIISSDIHLPEPTAPSSFSSITLRRSLRPHKHPTYLQDYLCHLLRSHDLSDHVSRPYPFPLSKVLSYDRLSASYKQFILNVSSQFEPKFYHQAVLYPEWRQAMQDELSALDRNKTLLDLYFCTDRSSFRHGL